MWPLILAHLFICVMGGRDGHCKQIPLGCVGSAHSGWTTLGLPQPKAACTSWVHSAQAPGCSARALSQVDPAFHALLRPKPLGFLGAPQGHRPRWAVCFVPFPDLAAQVTRCLVNSVPGGPCILFTCPVSAAQFPGCASRAQSRV